MNPSADHRFASLLTEGARTLTGLSLLACIPFRFDRNGLKWITTTVRAIAGIVARRTDIVVMTDTGTPADLEILTRLLEPLSASIQIRSFTDIPSPLLLPWQSKKVLTETFLADETHDLFVYLEDDLTFTAANLAYFVALAPILRRAGFIPSFIRIEYHRQFHGLFLVDQHAPQIIGARGSIEIDGLPFQSLDHPYAATCILDRELARTHTQSRSFEEPSSRGLVPWGLLERASLGQMLDSIPPGFTSAYLVPLSAAGRSVRPECLIHHAPDKYTNVAGANLVPVHALLQDDGAPPDPFRERAALLGQRSQLHIDELDATHVAGWAVRDGKPVDLAIEVDGLPITTIRADLFRRDLQHNGLADGRFGFNHAFNPSLTDRRTLALYVADTRELKYRRTLFFRRREEKNFKT